MSVPHSVSRDAVTPLPGLGWGHGAGWGEEGQQPCLGDGFGVPGPCGAGEGAGRGGVAESSVRCPGSFPFVLLCPLVALGAMGSGRVS